MKVFLNEEFKIKLNYSVYFCFEFVGLGYRVEYIKPFVFFLQVSRNKIEKLKFNNKFSRFQSKFCKYATLSAFHLMLSKNVYKFKITNYRVENFGRQ